MLEAGYELRTTSGEFRDRALVNKLAQTIRMFPFPIDMKYVCCPGILNGTGVPGIR